MITVVVPAEADSRGAKIIVTTQCSLHLVDRIRQRLDPIVAAGLIPWRRRRVCAH